jgi:prepilin-type N-terminal cleavage/methylation domain-containing protein
MKKARGFTLIELIVVILMVAVLAAVAIPIFRGRIEKAKWSEGKGMMGTIATAIRVYHAEKGPAAPPPLTLYDGNTGLGFRVGDLTGKYFADVDFTVNVTNMSPLAYVIICTPVTQAERPVSPATVTLNEAGAWTP